MYRYNSSSTEIRKNVQEFYSQVFQDLKHIRFVATDMSTVLNLEENK